MARGQIAAQVSHLLYSSFSYSKVCEYHVLFMDFSYQTITPFTFSYFLYFFQRFQRFQDVLARKRSVRGLQQQIVEQKCHDSIPRRKLQMVAFLPGRKSSSNGAKVPRNPRRKIRIRIL